VIKFKDLPIRRKIIVTILTGMGSAMLIAVVQFISFDRSTAKDYLYEEILTLAKITAKRSSVALAFQDVRNAAQNLSNLSIRNSIQSACIYNADRSLFSAYIRNRASGIGCAPKMEDMQQGYTAKSLIIIEPMSNKSRELGFLVVRSDLSPISERTKAWIYIGIGMFALAFVVAYVMSNRMQRSIAMPISRLSGVMRNVQKNNDLSLRAEVLGNDELGVLVTNFNQMLELIDSSNKDLQMLYDDVAVKSAQAEIVAVELEGRNQQIKEMIGGAAHDLRQPLQALSIFVDALGYQKDPNKREKIINKIQQSMTNLNELFDEVLDVSKAEQLAEEKELQSVSIKALINKLYVEFQAMATKKALDFRVCNRDITILSVPGILERIIRNLLSNAINYTDDGGVLLAVRWHREALLIDVWDTGRGIPAEKQKSIFKKFERIEEKPGEGKKSGYGLGLAIVNQFIQMLGYQLSVHSTYGRGSCFRITIPASCIESTRESFAPVLARANPEIACSPSSPITASSAVDSAGGVVPLERAYKASILLVDDDDDIRKALQEALQAWGANVAAFSSLSAITNYLAAGNYPAPDIIISDYQLEGDTTGNQVVSVARQAVNTKLPAVIITANTTVEIQQEIKCFGYDVMIKPVDISKLKNMICERVGI